jgi:hypothetical protein
MKYSKVENAGSGRGGWRGIAFKLHTELLAEPSNIEYKYTVENKLWVTSM